jgi:hypothetical protein
MNHKGDKLLVDIDHANLPANLAQRLDTLDFATPVQSIVTRAGTGVVARIWKSRQGQCRYVGLPDFRPVRGRSRAQESR